MKARKSRLYTLRKKDLYDGVKDGTISRSMLLNWIHSYGLRKWMKGCTDAYYRRENAEAWFSAVISKEREWLRGHSNN